MRERLMNIIKELGPDLTPLSLAWKAWRGDDEGVWGDLAIWLVFEAFKGASEEIVEEVIQDILMAPVMSYPGRSVRPLCKACGGVSLAARLLMDGIDIRPGPGDLGAWNFAPCPRCGGTGTEPEEGVDAAAPAMWGDVSWDWPPDSDDGYNGPEA